ncbi:MAG: OmpA family protein, partial [Gammaproteobacteria bacterium]
NLDKLAAFLGEYPDRTVLIEGHTDSVGSEESNQFLSQRRAESVRSYLVNRGVQAHRITTAGLGEGSPVASNDTATGRQQNRRVEVIISNTATRSGAN